MAPRGHDQGDAERNPQPYSNSQFAGQSSYQPHRQTMLHPHPGQDQQQQQQQQPPPPPQHHLAASYRPLPFDQRRSPPTSGGGGGVGRVRQPAPLVMAQSLQQPRSLLGYQQQLRSVTHEGILEQRTRSSGGGWKRRYCVLREGEFRYHACPETGGGEAIAGGGLGGLGEGPVTTVPLELATAVRTVRQEQHAFQVVITTRRQGMALADLGEDELVFRAPDQHTFHEW